MHFKTYYHQNYKTVLFPAKTWANKEANKSYSRFENNNFFSPFQLQYFLQFTRCFLSHPFVFSSVILSVSESIFLKINPTLPAPPA